MSALTTEQRLRYVGSSEVPAVVGKDPYRTRYDVWAEKTGMVPPPDLSENPRVQLGQFLEPYVAERWSRENGLAVEKDPNYYPHKQVAGYGASVDYRIEDGRCSKSKR